MGRIGVNPAKQAGQFPEYTGHRIIIPVYIPHLSDYFEHMLEIVDLSFQSLQKTISDNDAVTIINNGCCQEAVDRLMEYQEQGWIDQFIINQSNRGKIDALLSAARGCYEDFITFADCDAFFYPGWLQAVMQIFEAFPEAGWVSTQPAPDTTRLNTASTISEALFKGILRKRQVEATEDLNRFGESIGRPDMYRSRTNEYYLIVQRRNVTAVVGGNHFTFTIRRDVLSKIPYRPSLKFIAEEEVFGQPFDKAGYWRLSTPELHIQHMGNTPEGWMYEHLNDIRATELNYLPTPQKTQQHRVFPYYLSRLISRAVKKYSLVTLLKPV